MIHQQSWYIQKTVGRFLLISANRALQRDSIGIIPSGNYCIVVAGHGLIQERNINTGKMVEFEVSGGKIEAIHMIPGWTHNIINLSDTENLVTVMTCNEVFNPEQPDTFFEPV